MSQSHHRVPTPHSHWSYQGHFQRLNVKNHSCLPKSCTSWLWHPRQWWQQWWSDALIGHFNTHFTTHPDKLPTFSTNYLSKSCCQIHVTRPALYRQKHNSGKQWTRMNFKHTNTTKVEVGTMSFSDVFLNRLWCDRPSCYQYPRHFLTTPARVTSKDSM